MSGPGKDTFGEKVLSALEDVCDRLDMFLEEIRSLNENVESLLDALTEDHPVN